MIFASVSVTGNLNLGLHDRENSPRVIQNDMRNSSKLTAGHETRLVLYSGAQESVPSSLWLLVPCYSTRQLSKGEITQGCRCAVDPLRRYKSLLNMARTLFR